MVAPNRELANTIFLFILNPQSNLQESSSIRNQQMDIRINSPGGQLMLSSPNNSRESSILSNVSSVAYADRVQTLNNYLTWTEQVESIELQCSLSTLSYATVGEGTNATTDKAPVVETICVPHTTNTCILQDQTTPAIG